MFNGGLGALNFLFTACLLVWPTKHCPDLVCPETVVLETIPPAVSRSLDFSVDAAKSCQQSGPDSSVQLSFSLFWWGFLCGLVFAVLVSALWCLRCRRAQAPFKELVHPLAEYPQAVPPQTVLPAALTHGAQVAAAEPVNPRVLRELGLRA